MYVYVCVHTVSICLKDPIERTCEAVISTYLFMHHLFFSKSYELI